VSTGYRIALEGGPSFECADGENLVAAAERAGWALPASCRAGICGSCEGVVCDGSFVVPGRTGDGPLLQGPAQPVKLCRARPRSDLTIAPREFAPVDAASRKLLAAKVMRIDKPAADVAVLKLRFPAGVRAKFRAGQYLRVVLDDGAERSFSMANPPQQNDGVELHVRYLPGGRFAEALFHTLQPGDTVRLRMPQGDFWLRESDKPAVFVAGGTGFAPVQSMVEDLLRRNVARPVHVYFGARTPELLYRGDVAAQWTQKRAGLAYVPVVSSPEPQHAWAGRTGLVHDAVLADLPDLSGHQVYACGAPGMVAAAREAFVQHGLAPEDFFCDAFAPAVEQADAVAA
jgi:CDP-4-dehydro-6-deoxyglucose reductase/3-phenylpropionate/trans-cinnamate dioxygenase ferredoxin reductase subunit